jgi:N-acetylglucosamine kinase-like BadF-type ATPase
MKLIADSGSTKTDWCLIDSEGAVSSYKTQGINPFHQDREVIAAVLSDELLPQLTKYHDVTEISFYGSGVRTELEPLMEDLLRQAFPQASRVEAHGDLLGAARALCGNKEGIACILGTGANSCLYDGERIVQNTPPLGYILGDEGGGAVLGKNFLNGLLKGFLPQTLKEEFLQEQQMTEADVISRVYRQPLANRWLASLSEFIHRHLDELLIHKLVVDNFRHFIQRNVVQYKRQDLPLNAVGSIAYYYCNELKEAAESEGYTIGKVLRSPIEGLRKNE